MDIISDKSITPDMAAIEKSLLGKAQERWQALTRHIESNYCIKPQLAFSHCTAQPGWNVKYKKGGKALCTLYPLKDSFIALVVLGAADIVHFEPVQTAYSAYLRNLFNTTKLFNATKWLMVHVTEDAILDDVLKLLELKSRSKERLT